ncbi:MAG TPA: hypothetical protein DDX85_11160 [Nitrospiraceae bacterium]|nr:hypothetical protein [Nitrospiraceae bacterium]
MKSRKPRKPAPFRGKKKVIPIRPPEEGINSMRRWTSSVRIWMTLKNTTKFSLSWDLPMLMMVVRVTVKPVNGKPIAPYTPKF